MTLFGIKLRLRQAGTEASCDRLDGGQRIVEFVPKHSNQPLPSAALLLAERSADVRQDNQRVRQAFLAELTLPH